MIKKVEQFYWNDRPQVNQIVVTTDNGEYLVSYGTVVARKNGEEVELSYFWRLSPTTAKHVARFLGHSSSEEVKERVRWGEYKLLGKLVIE